MLKTKLVLAAAAVAGCLGATSVFADDSSGGVQIGVLSCNVSSGWGVIFGSTRDVNCTFSPAHGATEHYVGHISKYGVDIGYTQGGAILWGVFAPTATMAPGSLDGNYVGPTAGATVVVGAGVHALIGGFNRSISLQPVSVEGNAGLNVAAGIAAMNLKFEHNHGSES